MKLVKDANISILKEKPNVMHWVNSSGREEAEDAFFICDLGDVVRKYKLWNSELPRVTPFYAVKCNDDSCVLKLLAQLGAGFDCASKGEIQKVLELGVPEDRIIYANPCKQISNIRYAAKQGVRLMTFDNETELHKVKDVFPNAKLVLRILPPESTKVQCPLGIKFGAHPRDAAKLLKCARQLDLDVVGVSFHVGSGCYDPTAYSAAVASARAIFDLARDIGYDMNLLDVGGGFPGSVGGKITFEEITSCLRPALDLYFPESMGVQLMAEPGRFMVASAYTLTVNVIAKRIVPAGHPQETQISSEMECDSDNSRDSEKSDEPMFMYYVNDGVYGSFNCILFDHATVTPSLLRPEDYEGRPDFECSIWGPTCDGLDCIVPKYRLPELFDGDWLVFSDMGAYTKAASSTFNGMPRPRCFYVMLEHVWQQVETLPVQASCQLSAAKDNKLFMLEQQEVPAEAACS